MDPIRPIGPVERDVEPVVRVTRSSPDRERERPDQREGASAGSRRRRLIRLLPTTRAAR